MARELCKQVAIVERRPHILSTSCWRNCQGVDRLRGHGLAFFRRGETLKDDFVRARGLRRGGRFASKGRVLPPNWLSNFVTPMADGRATCPCVKVDLFGAVRLRRRQPASFWKPARIQAYAWCHIQRHICGRTRVRRICSTHETALRERREQTLGNFRLQRNWVDVDDFWGHLQKHHCIGEERCGGVCG
jgi:hypothetical protein